MLIDATPGANRSQRERELREARNRWHAVAISVPNDACAVAQECKGKRYLSSQAPLLPLAGCDSARCNCRYRHFDDRRQEPRRRDEAVGTPAARVTNERRKKGGRRAGD